MSSIIVVRRLKLSWDRSVYLTDEKLHALCSSFVKENFFPKHHYVDIPIFIDVTVSLKRLSKGIKVFIVRDLVNRFTWRYPKSAKIMVFYPYANRFLRENFTFHYKEETPIWVKVEEVNGS